MKSSVHVYTVQYKYYHKCTVEARKSLCGRCSWDNEVL